MSYTCSITSKLGSRTLKPSIQGLRGIAVLAVFIYHAFPELDSAGYLGVDIFFVISGYLITKNIIKIFESENVSVKDFYLRRILRLFPALIFTLILSLILATIVLFPAEFNSYVKHSFGGSTFLSNLLLSRENGYFNDSTLPRPLIHLWSLSLEFQFYLIYPSLLHFIYRRNKKLKFYTLTLVSLFALAVISQFISENFAFYLPFGRFWQFALGGLIHFLDDIYIKKDTWLIKISLPLFFLFIVFGNFNEYNFINSLLISVCTCFILCNHLNPLVQNLFSRTLLVFMGNISYSLYLIHLPILVFVQLIWPHSLSAKIISIVLSISLALFSTYLIENPIRNTKNINLTSALCIIILLMLGMGSLKLYLSNFAPLNNQIITSSIKVGDTGQEAFFRDLFDNSIECEDTSLYLNSPSFKGQKRCIQTKSGKSDVLIIGDSHAENLYVGLKSTYSENFKLVVRDGLPILVNENYSDLFTNLGEFNKLIIAGRWDLNANFMNDLKKTLTELSRLNKPILVVGDTPSFKFDAEQCKYQRVMSGNRRCTESNHVKLVNSEIKSLVEGLKLNNIEYLDASLNFCLENLCRMNFQNEIYFRDNNHLNSLGSINLSSNFKNFIFNVH